MAADGPVVLDLDDSPVVIERNGQVILELAWTLPRPPGPWLGTALLRACAPPRCFRHGPLAQHMLLTDGCGATWVTRGRVHQLWRCGRYGRKKVSRLH